MDGELLVTPAPGARHQLIIGDLHARLAGYLARHRDVAAVLLSPADITWSRERLTRYPRVVTAPR